MVNRSKSEAKFAPVYCLDRKLEQVEGDKEFDQPYFGDAQMGILMESE